MRTIVRFSISGVLLICSTVAAIAQEYCVACAGPNAVYRCTITGARPGLSQSLQMACITALAKDGRHASCAVKRGGTVFDCDGPVKTVAIGADAGPGAPELPAAVIATKAATAPADPKSPPATVLEAVTRAQKATGEGVRKANDAAADFFKRTFTCLGSLFTKCGQD